MLRPARFLLLSAAMTIAGSPASSQEPPSSPDASVGGRTSSYQISCYSEVDDPQIRFAGGAPPDRTIPFDRACSFNVHEVPTALGEQFLGGRLFTGAGRQVLGA